MDGNRINCPVYLKPGLVGDRTDLSEGRFHLPLRARAPQNIALQTQESGRNQLRFGGMAWGGDVAKATHGSP